MKIKYSKLCNDRLLSIEGSGKKSFVLFWCMIDEVEFIILRKNEKIGQHVHAHD